MVRIVDAAPRHAFAITALTRAAFASTAMDLPSSALKERVSDVRAWLAAHEALIAFEGADLGTIARPIGALRFRICEDGIHFRRLAVLPAVQGRGVGTHLLDALEARAKREGAKALLTSARRARPDRRAMYWKRGFETVRSEDVYGVPELKTYLRKALVP